MSYTKELMQAAIIETALSFYRHGPWVQYDSNPMVKPLGWKLRRCDTSLTAESAAPDNWLYTVCSDFTHRVYRDATDYLLAPTSLEYWTVQTSHVSVTDPITVYKFGDDDGEQDVEKAIRESLERIEPGDIITYYVVKENAQGGHSMLYLGDYFGDGKRYILHSAAPGGGKFDIDTGVDKIEPTGSIQLQTTDEIAFYPPENTLRRRDLRQAARFTVHRPLNVMEWALTPAALTRLQYRGLVFTKTLDRPQYADVLPGGEVTVTLTLENRGGEDWHGLPVTDPVPAGQRLTAVTGGGVTDGGAVKWLVDLPAGQSTALTYTIRACGRPGELIRFAAGTVGDIKTRATALKIAGRQLTDLQKQALLRVEPGVFPKFLGTGEWFDLGAVERFYYSVLGEQIELPKTVEEFLSPLLELRAVEGSDVPLICLKSGAKIPDMVLYKHLGGAYFCDGADMDRRVLEYREEHFTPGDVLICLTGAGTELFSPAGIELQIVLGGGRALVITPDGSRVDTFEKTVGRDLKMHFVTAIRPNLVSERPL
ncbi:MAG: DUF11 domain-containing protein [Oscillospiraceae bacterium]|nr:DUF11 domain-containing protein [Oscillospiraceae bacterium]